MSGSSRRVNPPSGAEHGHAAWRRREEGRGVCYLVSLGLHVLAVAALVYFTPIRQILTEPMEQPGSASSTLSANQLQELSDAIETKSSEVLRQNVEALDGILDQIDDLQNDVAQKFDQFDAQRTQTAAQDALKEMNSAVDKMNQAAELLDQQSAAEEVDRAQALAEQAQQRAQDKLAQVPYDVSEVQKEQTKAQESHTAAKEVFGKGMETASQVEDSQARLDAQGASVTRLLGLLETARSNPRASAASVKTAEDRVKEEEQKLRDAQKELEQTKAKREAEKSAVVEAQKKAVEVQKQAMETLAGVIGQHPQVSVTATVDRSEQRSESVDTGAMDPVALYNSAKALEDKVAEQFKEVRAMDLAMVRDMKLANARDNIDVVRPERPKLNEELLREAVRTDTKFEAAKEELKTALRETNSMVDLSNRMLDMAQQSVEGMKFGTEAPGGASADQDGAGLLLRIKELAMEDVSGRYADLSGAMKEMGAGQAKDGAEGEEGGLSKEGPESGDLTGEAGAEKGRARRGSGSGTDLSGMPALSPDVPAVGARMVKVSGQAGNWMYVDSWYTLGPFPNPNRVNIDREFPPDSIIDLDANYVGKGGRVIRWHFVQSEKPQVIPADAQEYGIWYAYTELFFEQPCDMIIALGTDDRGVLKINGVPVWISSKQLKAWRIDEVWRKVHFKKGVNRVLFRVENGWQNIAFSVVLRLAE